MNDSEFSTVMALISLVTDPAAAKAQLLELRSAREALEVQETATSQAAAALETERGKLAAQAAALRERELRVHADESRIATDVAALETWNRDRRTSRLVQHAGGLTSEPDDTEVAPDPIGDRYAPSMGSPEAVRAAPRHRGRARA